MNFQVRLTIALAVVAAVPLGVLGYGVRSEAVARLDAESARRVQAVESALAAKLADQVASDRHRLELLAAGLAGDNRFRIALGAGADRRWLLDWAPAAMKLAGFAVLQVQDSTGRILSSGQFRNDFDRVALALPRAAAFTPTQGALVDARTPDGSVRALVTTVATTVRGERFTVTGGGAFDSARVAALSSDALVAARLVTGPESARTPIDAPRDVPGGMPLPYIDESSVNGPTVARIVLVPDSGPMQALKADIARWLAIAMSLTLLVAVLVAALFGRFISAPVTQLAERATKLERVAAMGDLARQVNHDIKNGLAPIRNVLRHLTQTAEKEPDTLATIYAERQPTLEAGMEYLDQLARNYARLSPSLTRGSTDPGAVIREVARSANGAAVDVRLPDALPGVRTDAVVLHRILDNLVSNAVDALDGTPGTVSITAASAANGGEPRVRIAVADTGRGMSRDEMDRAFTDFYTTKPSGTGLGLSVVRRLLTDVGGSLRAESAPGKGSTFTVELPAEPKKDAR